MTAVCGVYAIINKINGNIYIGSSINIHRRKLRHFRYLSLGGHENKHLQNAYNLYGNDAFEFVILKTTEPNNRLLEEQIFLDKYFGTSSCYNICPTAGSPGAPGRIKTDMHRKKIADSLRQYYDKNPSHKEYLSSLRKGKSLSPAIRKKMSDGHKKGELHHNSKLTEDIVRQVRQKYSPRTYSYGKLSAEFGVDRKTIIRIIKGKTWTHIS
jgi:group I intron endonuclease